MGYEFRNIEFIQAFVKNLDDLSEGSEQLAQEFSNILHAIVLERIDKSIFLGGMWAEKPYSDNPIKAYKLGNAVVSGEGMGKQLTINGILISDEDWYWGAWDREKKGVELSAANPVANFGDYTSKPVPVFIPGYRTWRVEYNQLSDQVDLQFTGSMMDNFDVEISRTKGSNQFGGNYLFDFIVDEPFDDIGEITNYYRNWLQITEEELRIAIEQAGESVSRILFR